MILSVALKVSLYSKLELIIENCSSNLIFDSTFKLFLDFINIETIYSSLLYFVIIDQN